MTDCNPCNKQPNALSDQGDKPNLRLTWVVPTLEKLPRLSELTLQSGGSIGGSGDAGGGGVF